MSFVQMMLQRVDPFAIYAAERELMRRGWHVPRNLLASHYLLMGQLRTLVENVIALPTEGNANDAIGRAMIEGPNERTNPRFVAPFRTGLLNSGLALGFLAVGGVVRLILWRVSPSWIDWRWLVGAAALIVALSMLYGWLGAKIGREKAKQWIALAIVLGAIAFFYWFTRWLDHARR